MSRKTRHHTKRKAILDKRTPPGSAPGTLVADPDAPAPVIRVMGFGPEGMRETEASSAAVIEPFLGRWPVVWVSVEGLGDAAVIEAVGKLFALHPLSLEDVLHVHQRPKLEQYDAYLYLVARTVTLNDRLETEQFSLFLGDGFILTFQERAGGQFEAVRERIRKGAGPGRHLGPDYLAWALTDALIDGYFPVLERYGERLEDLEDEVVAKPLRSQVQAIHEAKRDLLTIRRSIWPLRDALSAVGREGIPHISADSRIFFRDCYDHTIQIIDFVETYREVATGLMDVYLSSMSNRLNEVMKVLTIIATIFIPLSFVASLYGMNFDASASPWNMPELKWRFGYPFALALMAGLAIVMLVYFLRKGWFGGGEDGEDGRS